MAEVTNHQSPITNHVSRFTHYASRLTNPIIIKEMRAQMRGARAFLILTGYLSGLGGLAYGLYRITLRNAQNYFGPGASPQSAYIGQALFAGLALLELGFVCFITPALTAGAISGEDERRTYDTLLATPLRSSVILWGKMFASLTYILLLILAVIPLSSIVFLFGGVVLRDMIQVVGLLGLTAVSYGAVGLFFSALTRRTGRATVLSYLVVVSFTFGTVFVWAVVGALRQQVPPREILYLNPVSALSSAIMTPEMVTNSYAMGPVVQLLMALSGGGEILGFYSPIAPGRPVWQYTTALYLAMTVVMYLLTTQLIKPVRRWRIGWRSLVGLLLILALLGGGLWFVFGTRIASTGWQPAPVPTAVPVPAIPVAPAPTTSPLPPPTPVPTPTPFDFEEHRESIHSFLEQNLFPAGEKAFCDLAILSIESDQVGAYANVWTWAYCRAFDVADGELVPGAGVSAPAVVSLYWTPDQGWQITGHWLGSPRDALSPAAQEKLRQEPYDEAAGEERVRERARRSLLGE